MTFLRFIILAGIVYMLFKWLRKNGPSAPKPRPFDKSGGRIEEMEQDPVCGTYVPAVQAVTLTRAKEILYFCSDECREKYKQISKTN